MLKPYSFKWVVSENAVCAGSGCWLTWCWCEKCCPPCCCWRPLPLFPETHVFHMESLEWLLDTRLCASCVIDIIKAAELGLFQKTSINSSFRNTYCCSENISWKFFYLSNSFLLLLNLHFRHSVHVLKPDFIKQHSLHIFFYFIRIFFCNNKCRTVNQTLYVYKATFLYLVLYGHHGHPFTGRWTGLNQSHMSHYKSNINICLSLL